MEQFTPNNTAETGSADDSLVRKVWTAPHLSPIDVVEVTNLNLGARTDGSGSVS